jgi:hypothetical protein
VNGKENINGNSGYLEKKINYWKEEIIKKTGENFFKRKII